MPGLVIAIERQVIVRAISVWADGPRAFRAGSALRPNGKARIPLDHR